MNAKTFTGTLFELKDNNTFGAEAIEAVWKLSDVYQAYDSIDYYLDDTDKLPMTLVDGSSLVNDDIYQIIDGVQFYFNGTLASAKKLVEALEKEIESLKNIQENRKLLEEMYKKA